MLFLPLLFACNDMSTATGEFGRINYHLNTPFALEDFWLTDAKLVTGYPQEIETNLTPKGWGKTEEPYLITHKVDSASVVVDVDLIDELLFNVPDFTMTAHSPGEYSVESTLEGALFDRIKLNFSEPDDLEIISWIRSPNEDEFQKETGSSIEVDQGAQITMLPIPAAEGKRLAGAVDVSISAEPASALVQNLNVEEVGEDGVIATSTPVSFFFVEPGTVAITITDIVNNVSTVQEYEVKD